MKFGVCIFGERPLPEVINQVKLAEELGYDSVWLADSQLLCRELYVTLTACALSTSRIRLGAGVTAPVTRHASVTASAFATLNEIAEGRLALGIGTGNSLARTIGQRPSSQGDLRGYVEKASCLLGNKSTAFEGGVEGKLTWLEEPLTAPIYVAATGPKMTRWAPALADGVILLVGAAPEVLEHSVRLVGEGVREAGKRYEDLNVVCWVPASISSNGQLAREHTRGHVAALLRRLSPDYLSTQDREALLEVRDSLGYFPHANKETGDKNSIPERFIDLLSLAGSPSQVEDKVRQIMDMDSFTEIVLNTQAEMPGFPAVEQVLKDFAEGVIARVR